MILNTVRQVLPSPVKQLISRGLPNGARERLVNFIADLETRRAALWYHPVRHVQGLVPQIFVDLENFSLRLAMLHNSIKSEHRPILDAFVFEEILNRQDPDLLREFREAILKLNTSPALNIEKAEAEFFHLDFERAAQTLQGVNLRHSRVTPSRRQLLKFIPEISRLIQDHGSKTQSSTAPSSPSAPPFYVLHSSFPSTLNGYAARSHAMLLAIKRLGQSVYPVTLHREKSEEKNRRTGIWTEEVDGISYHRLPSPPMVLSEEIPYMQRFASELANFAKQVGTPPLIQAASNYYTGFPALLTARKLGVPFVYEVRGLWELTRLSHEPHFASSRRFHYARAMETYVARSADAVLTLNIGLRDELVRRGVDPGRIQLVPNGVDPSRFKAMPKNDKLRRKLGIEDHESVVGYVGSIVGYEGLDDLLSATALLRDKPIKTLIVGNGPSFGKSREAVHALDLKDRVILTGRVPHEQVEDYYSCIDICVFPRKPFLVCEIVTPMKPFEAFAMGKTVIVSNVSPLAEIVQPEQTGFVFKAGHVFALAEVLSKVIAMPAVERQKIGAAGRAWVEAERTWEKSVQVIVVLYREYGQRSKSTPALSSPL